MNHDYICTQCGGNNILTDAWAYWNVTTQKWEIESLFDETVCGDCGAKNSEVKTESKEKGEK